MKILGIETATAVCSVALAGVEGGPIERSIGSKQMHSEKILLLIDECLAAGKIQLRDLDGIAVSIGPGSFTGLRIGLSVAKGLAYASGLPLCGIPTLLGLARRVAGHCQASRRCNIVSMIDARRDEVYFAVYRRKGSRLEELIAPRAEILSGIPDLINSVMAGEDAEKYQDIIIAGDGAEKFREYCKNRAFYKSSSYIFPSTGDTQCSAVPVAEAGAERIGEGGSDPIENLEPLYIKEFFATAKKTK